MLLAGLYLWSAVALGSCLVVSEQSLTLDNSQAGAAEASWWAVVENRCERAHDAVLTIRFVNEDGQRLFDVRDQVVIERLGRVELQREVYVPTRYASKIKGLKIDIEERERPF